MTALALRVSDQPGQLRVGLCWLEEKLTMILFQLRRMRKKLTFGLLLSLSVALPWSNCQGSVSLLVRPAQMKDDFLLLVALSIKLRVFKMHKFLSETEPTLCGFASQKPRWLIREV